MKKLIILVLLMAAGMAWASGSSKGFEAGKDCPDKALPGNVNGYSKDFFITVPLNAEPCADTALANSDTLAVNFVARRRTFFIPEAAELMKAWITSSDSTLDSFRLRINIFSFDSSVTDTAAYYGKSAKGIKKLLGFCKSDTFSFTTTVTKRQFDAGEMGSIQVDTTASTTVLPTQIPQGMKVIMLFRPKSWPKASDQYIRRK